MWGSAEIGALYAKLLEKATGEVLLCLNLRGSDWVQGGSQVTELSQALALDIDWSGSWFGVLMEDAQ